MEHWKTYGRNYYCRFDYEALTLEQAGQVTSNLTESFEKFNVKFNFFYFLGNDGRK